MNKLDTAHRLYPELQKALGIPEDLKVKRFQLDLQAGSLVTATVTLDVVIYEEKGAAIVEVLKNYKLIERKEEQ